jgi:hypothetical protein
MTKNNLFLIQLFSVLGSLMFLAACGTNENPISPPTPLPSPSSSPSPSLTFSGVFSGSAVVTPSVNQNTITLSWTQPTSSTPFQIDPMDPNDNGLTYFVYVSRSNNISTLTDALANGRVLNSAGSVNTISSFGLTNQTTYYLTVVVKDSGSNQAAFNSISVTTGTGPSISSFSTSSGVPTAIGIGLNTIWAAPNEWVFIALDTGSNCTDPSPSGYEANLSYYFGTSGQTDTEWTPGNDGGGGVQTLAGQCVSLCADYGTASSKVCSAPTLVTGN